MPVDYAALIESIDLAIQKAIENGGVVEYTIGNRGLKRYTLQELWDMRANYSALLRAENNGTCFRQKRARFRSDRFGC
jgi:hypothetical protein